MKANVFVGIYHSRDTEYGVSYMVLNESKVCISANATVINARDSLECEFKTVNFVMEGMRYIYADTICIYLSNPSVVSCLNGAIKPQKGYVRWIESIQHRASFLHCALDFKWAMAEALQLVNNLARLAIGSNSH